MDPAEDMEWRTSFPCSALVANALLVPESEEEVDPYYGTQFLLAVQGGNMVIQFMEGAVPRKVAVVPLEHVEKRLNLRGASSRGEG